MDQMNKLRSLKRQIIRDKTVTIKLPSRFSFKDHNVAEFETALSIFRWDLQDIPVIIDMRSCSSPNYQTLSLLVVYGWHLKSRGCKVTYLDDHPDGASELWRKMGARGTFPVLFSENQQFVGNSMKPLLAVRNTRDFKNVIETAESYTDGFAVEYASTLRYVLSELLYNALEHGSTYGIGKGSNIKVPAITQFTWYAKSNEIHFIIADCGMGIKKHIEQAYPGQESDIDAIKLSLKSQRSGTFGLHNPYTDKNNAGMGLYISSNIIRRLNADMYIISGNGVVHISPRDVTGKFLPNKWQGTFVLVTIRLEKFSAFNLHKTMQEFREAAEQEQLKARHIEASEKYYININNIFGRFAEEKESAIKQRDKKIFPELNSGKNIVLDFDDVASCPHSFLSALLASPIKTLGMSAYKRIKIVNASSEIRETIDFIFDDNT